MPLRRLEATREVRDPSILDTIRPGSTDAEVLERTVAAVERYNIVRAVTSGPLLENYVAAMPEVIIPSLQFGAGDMQLEWVRELFESGKYQVLGEVVTQYDGMSPDDPRLEPYLAMAESLEIPVGLHMGMGGPNPSYRARNGNPLLLEDVLVRHPRLRLYVMHAGYPMLGEMKFPRWT